MRSTIRRLTLASALVAAFGFTAGAALADECQTPEGAGRTISGEIKTISGKNLIVASKGEQIKFDKFASASVKGKKTSWDDLKKGDYVTVCSKLLAKPRLAYEVTVSDKPKDEAVDVQ